MHVQNIIWKCDYDKVISNMTKELLCKQCGQNDVSLYKQDAYKITLQWFKNDY